MKAFLAIGLLVAAICIGISFTQEDPAQIDTKVDEMLAELAGENGDVGAEISDILAQEIDDDDDDSDEDDSDDSDEDDDDDEDGDDDDEEEEEEEEEEWEELEEFELMREKRDVDDEEEMMPFEDDMMDDTPVGEGLGEE